MAITISRLSAAAVQATGWDALPEGSTLVDLVNEAHTAWIAEASWGYLNGQIHTDTTVADQEDYELPANVVEVRTAWVGDNLSGRLMILDADELERRKGMTYVAPESYSWAALRYRASLVAANDGEPRPFLSIWPAATAGQTLTVLYRGGAVRIEEDDDVLQIPLALEPAFLEWFRAYTRGVTMAGVDLVTELARVRESPMFRAALRSQQLHRAITPTTGTAGDFIVSEAIDDFPLEVPRRYE